MKKDDINMLVFPKYITLLKQNNLLKIGKYTRTNISFSLSNELKVLYIFDGTLNQYTNAMFSERWIRNKLLNNEILVEFEQLKKRFDLIEV